MYICINIIDDYISKIASDQPIDKCFWKKHVQIENLNKDLDRLKLERSERGFKSKNVGK